MPDGFEHRNCPACGAANPKGEVASETRAESMTLDALRPFWSGLFKEKRFFSYDRCGRCAMLYTPTFFSEAQLGELYADMAPNMDMVPSELLEATQRGYWQMAKRGAALDGDYLEIGPDIGYIVAHAAREGNFGHVWLVEPNRAVHAQLGQAAGEKPRTIIADMDDLSPIPDGSIGLAVMIHVLDHLLDPMASLEQVRRKLKPSGRVVIVTHNEKSVLRSVMGKRWPPFCLQHPQLFNPASITDMASRVGYSSVDVARSTNYFPIGFMTRQAAYTVGIDLSKVPLPRCAIGLKLGNMITVAHA